MRVLPDKRFCAALVMICLLGYAGLSPRANVGPADSAQAVLGVESWTVSGLTNSSLNPQGRIRSIAVSPLDSSFAYAVRGDIVVGGISHVNRTTDGGQTWFSVNVNQETGLFAASVVVDPRNRLTVYAAGFGTTSLAKSTDGGQTWAALPVPLSGTTSDAFISAAAVDPSNPNTLYIGYSDRFNGKGIYKSTNGGASWTKTGAFDVPLYSLAVDPRNPNIVYSGNGFDASVSGQPAYVNGYKSLNGGRDWDFQIYNLGNFVIVSLAIDPVNTAVIYGATQGGGIWKSINGGASAFRTNAGLTNLNVSAVVIDPTNPNVIYAGTRGGGIFKSTDAGANWQAFNDGLTTTPSRDVTTLAISGDGRKLYAGTLNGVYIYQYQSATCFVECLATGPTSGRVGAAVSFTGGASLNSCVGAAAYEWDFGDSTAKSAQQSPAHTYAQPGTYTWTLTVRVPGAAPCNRAGTVAVGAPCAYTVAPAEVSLGAAGGIGSLAVTAEAGCAWTAASSAPWLKLTAGAAGSGSGTVGFAAEANTTPSPRTATLTAAGKTVTVTQAAVGEVLVARLKPNRGKEGTEVSIIGANLDQVTAVVFGGNRPGENLTKVSPALLTVRVPRNARTGNLRLVTPAGVVTTTAQFRVLR